MNDKHRKIISELIDCIFQWAPAYSLIFVYLFLADGHVFIALLQGTFGFLYFLDKYEMDKTEKSLKETTEDLRISKHNLSVALSEKEVAYELLTEEQKILYCEKIKERDIPSPIYSYGSIVSRFNFK